jgi:hypothetical protein
MRLLGLVVLFASSCSALAHAQPGGTTATAPPAPVLAPEPIAATSAPDLAAPAPSWTPQPELPPAQSAPAPYYGYGYADPGRLRALNELQHLDLRIAQLKQSQKQHGIVGPAILTAVGYTVTLVFGAIALADWAIAENFDDGLCGQGELYDYDPSCDVNNDGYVNPEDEDAARTLARTLGALSVVGTGVGIAGTVLLVRRLAKRREFKPELKDLGARRGQLLQQLRYGGVYSARGVQLTVSARF